MKWSAAPPPGAPESAVAQKRICALCAKQKPSPNVSPAVHTEKGKADTDCICLPSMVSGPFGRGAFFGYRINTYRPFRTSKFSPFREANRKVNFCRFFKGSRRFSAVQKLSVHPPIVYAVLRKFTAFWRKLWRKFCAHIRGWPQPVQTPFRRTHSCCGCRHPR